MGKFEPVKAQEEYGAGQVIHYNYLCVEVVVHVDSL